MSLTSFLALKDVKAKFREEFSKPSVSTFAEMQAVPLTKNYSVVGSAFDYLLRFYLERRYPSARATHWVAEIALRSPILLHHRTVFEQAQTIVQMAREHQKQYLQNGRISDDLLHSCVLLSHIDMIYRPGIIPPQLGIIDERDILDLRNLINLVTPLTFRVEHNCLLNPTFGAASLLVGGADADLVIDNTIIDIKTTKKPTLQSNHFFQIVGYCILSRLGGIDGMPEEYRINQVGIYSSRYGRLLLFRLDEIADETKFRSFSEWFVERAEQESGRSFDKLKNL